MTATATAVATAATALAAGKQGLLGAEPATAGVAFAEDTDEGWIEGEQGRREVGRGKPAEATGAARKGGEGAVVFMSCT